MARVAVAQQVETARRFCEACRLGVLTGQADADRLYYWSFRCLDAERSGDSPLGAYEAHLSRMRRLESDLATRAAAGLARADETAQARFFVSEAGYWLGLTRSGDTSDARLRRDPSVAPAGAEPPEGSLDELRVALLQSAEAAWAGCRARFKGDGKGLEAACLASVRLLQAGRDAGQEERVCYEAHLERVLELDRELRRRERSGGGVAPLDVAVGEYFRWEAEYMHGLVAPKRGRSPEAFAERRYAASKEAYRGLRGGFRCGEGISERMYLWSLRWMRAQRDLDEERGQTPNERSTLADHLERMAGFRNHLRAELPPGVSVDLGALDYFVMEAEAWMAGLPPA